MSSLWSCSFISSSTRKLCFGGGWGERGREGGEEEGVGERERAVEGKRMEGGGDVWACMSFL